jgi:hypothetical protein
MELINQRDHKIRIKDNAHENFEESKTLQIQSRM